ncbi:thiamine biosynthesis protein ThiS [Leptospira perolatii]|uniref:Thiamine biosynthesis protein ThiS n=1 Tax=Leptospira perolatii TaxID=2023191 RepID=A0A2M9ZMJ8_9LEPT|nr:sulfur carrier protein ThiS [Leptospira perolatii]PJZ70109.1 thiamine biosynthesis protein ThiS [Leptospira perolatii]PJZ73298.1 thiamine biosynthesis protein ThiS [Leptospira perolatii]
MKVNGREILLGNLSSPSVNSLLESLHLKPEMVALQRNGEILKRNSWQEVVLEEGDRIEILKMVGGG